LLDQLIRTLLEKTYFRLMKGFDCLLARLWRPYFHFVSSIIETRMPMFLTFRI
jgi:hypothetical protein